jgi:hypothetical protein
VHPVAASGVAAAAAVAVAAGATATVLAGGIRLGAPVVFALLATAFVALAVIAALDARGRGPSARSVLLATAGLLALAVTVPPVSSRDLWSYAFYGRVVVRHHQSPYTAVPADFPQDPWSQRVAPGWRRTPSVYGPGFTAVAAGVMRLAGESPLAARLAFQGLAAAAVAVVAAVVYRRTRDPVAVALVGLNPVMVVAVANAGHNDALVALGGLAAVLAAARGRGAAAGAALGAAVLVKASGVFLAVGVGMWLFRRAGLRRALAALCVAAGLVAGGYAMAGGPAALRPLAEARLRVSGASVWNVPRIELTEERIEAGERGRVAGVEVRRLLSTGSTLVVCGIAVLLAWRRSRDPLPALGAAGALLAFTLAGTYVLSWYLAPAIVLGALAWRSVLTWMAVGQAALLELAYVPDITPHLGGTLASFARFQVLFRSMAVPLVEAVAVAALVAAYLRPSRRPPRAAMP